MKIRLAKNEDAAFLANLHIASLGYTFLGKLGPSFLRKIHYRNILRNPQSFTLVAEIDGEIDGFVTFSHNGFEFENQLKSKKIESLPYLVLAAIKSPWIVSDLIAMLTGSQIEFFKPWNSNMLQLSELFTIAVNPKSQSKGVGSALIMSGVAELKKRLKNYQGCYVKTDTERAENFYMKNGFTRAASEKRGHTKFSILFLNP